MIHNAVTCMYPCARCAVHAACSVALNQIFLPPAMYCQSAHISCTVLHELLALVAVQPTALCILLCRLYCIGSTRSLSAPARPAGGGGDWRKQEAAAAADRLAAPVAQLRGPRRCRE